MALFDDLQQQLRTVQPPQVGGSPEIASLLALPAQARVTNAIAGAGNRAGIAQINKADEQQRYDTKVAEDKADYERRNQIIGLNQEQRAITNAEEAKRRSASLAKAKKEGYERVINASGGYDFVGPDGNRVTAYEFSKANGTPIHTVLSGSLDPNQNQFIDDYQSVFDFNKLVLDYAQIDSKLKNKKAVSTIQKKEKDGKKLTPEEKTVLDYVDNAALYPDFIKKTPGEMLQAVVQQYPDIFKAGQFTPPVVGGQAAPENPAEVSGPLGLGEKLMRIIRGG